MKIIVAGAGAGKTTRMAGDVLARYKEVEEKKIIYVVTYTNNSRDSIKEKIVELNGEIPTYLYVETIHVFLYRELIKPYSNLLFNEHYTQLTLAFLGNDPKFRNYQISELRKKGILHVDKVSEIAKWVVDKRSTDLKIHKDRRAIILKVLQKNIDSIFVDEAQDMDENMRQIFEALNEAEIYLHLIGDPKQDLRGKKQFAKLIADFQENVEYIEKNYRSPKSHVDLSNLFIPKKEAQIIHEEKAGEVFYIFESEVENSFFNQDNWDYQYIYQRKDQRYETALKERNSQGEVRLEIDLRALIEQYLNLDDEQQIKLFSWVLSKKIIREYAEKEVREVARFLCKILNISKLSKKEYAQLSGVIEEIRKHRCKGVSSVRNVSSIERIKGLEGDRCLFILSSALYPYFSKEKKTKNRTLNHLYVALTRSSKELVILITNEVEATFGKNRVETKFKEYSVQKYPL